MSGCQTLRETLRQMLAVLEAERQALAGLDLGAIMGAANDKSRLCGTLDDAGQGDTTGPVLDEECRALLEAARRQNAVNRQIRNLVAANVSARLEALTGSPQLYAAGPSYAYAGRRA